MASVVFSVVASFSRTFSSESTLDADGIASLDLFVVPTISFQLLYGLLILKHGRREILCLAATAHPSAEWISRQLMEAYGWEEGPCYLVGDRHSVYGEVFIRRLRAMGIRDRPIAPRSPWQNGHCERLIGSIRRECLDHILVFGERHLRHLLCAYANYYNRTRTHLSLNNDRRRLAPSSHSVAYCLRQSWADCTTNTSGFSFRQGQLLFAQHRLKIPHA
jgi:transposase InsO family protein